MPIALVFAVYGVVVLFALFLLYQFRATHWYLHALSVAIALIVGLTPIPPAWHVPVIELMFGAVFLLFFTWGALAPLFPHLHHRTHHPRSHHA